MLTAERKYTAFWGAFLMASVMLAVERLTGGEWVTFVSLVYGAYITGNIGEYYNEARNVDNT